MAEMTEEDIETTGKDMTEMMGEDQRDHTTRIGSIPTETLNFIVSLHSSMLLCRVESRRPFVWKNIDG